MPSSLAFPAGFSYVAGAMLSVVWLLTGQGMIVYRLRLRVGIKYPQLYAEKAEVDASKLALRFNCAQRSHQNTLENAPLVLVTTLISGLKCPIFAASACGIWSLSRIIYTYGYITGGPDKRNSIGALFGPISFIALLLSSTYTASAFILSGI